MYVCKEQMRLKDSLRCMFVVLQWPDVLIPTFNDTWGSHAFGEAVDGLRMPRHVVTGIPTRLCKSVLVVILADRGRYVHHS